MLKRAGWLGRAVVVAVVGVAVGLAGVVGQSVAQSDVKKDGTTKMDDKMKTGDTMKSGDTMQSADKMKSGDGMKKGEMTGDIKANDMKKDDKMMEKKQ
jgi:hypothetical protein